MNCSKALEAEIDQIVTSFLGPNKRSKFVVSDGDTILVNCPLKLLENINLEQPTSHILYESLLAFHNEYGCGVNSFLLMWSGWFCSIKKLLEREPTYVNIFEELIAGLEYVINFIKSQEICLSNVVPLVYKHIREITLTDQLKDRSSKFLSGISTKTLFKTETTKSINILKQSRHLCQLLNAELSEENYQLEKRAFKNSQSLNDNIIKELRFLLEKLSHGCDALIPLIIDVWKKQIQEFFSVRFKKEFIMTYTIPGQNFSYSSVVDGIVVKCQENYRILLGENKSYNALLVGGDVIPNYIHLGFTPKVSIENITNDIAVTNDSWLERVIDTIKKLRVSLLLVQGRVNEDLIYSLKNSVIVINHVPYSTLKLLSDCTEANIVSYLDNSRDVNTCSITMEELHTNKDVKNGPKHVVIKVANNFIQTVIIYHELSQAANQLEHQFWHLANRLSRVCNAEKVLRGNGQIEKICMEKLYQYAENHCGDEYLRADVYQVLAEGFEHYIRSISKVVDINDKNLTEIFIAYDEPQSKVEGWRAALRLAILMVQMDTLIINSSSNKLNKEINLKRCIIGEL
ncbi:Bardet-Biedl syndrome 12 protein-like [Centruroides vittatus]|uniref:Bardet-Biedl syndrome 12 protein-like n=1 Tax=Centruroides vittatus TaxID=120091 RepID=UPI00351087DA